VSIAVAVAVAVAAGVVVWGTRVWLLLLLLLWGKRVWLLLLWSKRVWSQSYPDIRNDNMSNTCSLCSSTYVWPADLKRHIKSKHG
jgi:hypothetical protein